MKRVLGSDIQERCLSSSRKAIELRDLLYVVDDIFEFDDNDIEGVILRCREIIRCMELLGTANREVKR